MSDFATGFQQELEKIAASWEGAHLEGGNLNVSTFDTRIKEPSRYLESALPPELRGRVKYTSEPYGAGGVRHEANIVVPVAVAKQTPALQPYLRSAMKQAPLHKKLYYKLKGA